jgi:hypothetical protein
MPKSYKFIARNFVNNLKKVDFSQVDFYSGIRLATLLATPLVVGVITSNFVEGIAQEISIVMFGTVLILAIDELQPTVSRKGLLFSSLVYASILAIGVAISTIDFLVIPLFGIGLFIISYLNVLPRAFVVTLTFAGIVFFVGLLTHDASIALAGQMFQLFVLGGLWAILGGMIFPERNDKKHHPIEVENTTQMIHSQRKPTLQDKLVPLIDNFSLHSRNFQFAIALALASVGVLLAAQWFELQRGGWILIPLILVLLPAEMGAAFTFSRIVHLIIGTLIGAVIAAAITHNVMNQWLLTFFFLIFTAIYVTIVKVKNTAIVITPLTVMILILVDLPNPSPDLSNHLLRIQYVSIGCAISLLIAAIILIASNSRSTKVA